MKTKQKWFVLEKVDYGNRFPRKSIVIGQELLDGSCKRTRKLCKTRFISGRLLLSVMVSCLIAGVVTFFVAHIVCIGTLNIISTAR